MRMRLVSGGNVHYLDSGGRVAFRVTKSNDLVYGLKASANDHGMRTCGNHTLVHVGQGRNGDIITIGSRNLPATFLRLGDPG